MVNTSIQHKIRLLGPGLRNKPSGNYQPGEYKQFSNVEIVDQVVRTRRSIVPAGDDVVGPLKGHEITNPTGFVGVSGDRVIVVGTTEQVALSTNDGVQLWAPTALPVGSHIVAYFEYNKTSYWLVDYITANTNHEYRLYYGTSLTSTFASLTMISLFTEEGATFKSFFIFKDRLFIVTANGVRFSKATDPKIYTVPDGGFFSIPNQEVNAACAIRDSIYVGTSLGVHVFTYAVDPNQDGTLRPIFEGSEILSMAVHSDVPFASSSYSLNQINNHTVQKVLDYEDVVPEDASNTDIKLVSFQDSIFIIRRTYEQRDTTDSFYPGVSLNADNDYGDYRVLSLNTESQSLNKVTFNDCNDLTPALRGGIVDSVVPGESGNPVIYFLTARPVGTDFKARTYFTEYPRNDKSNLTGLDTSFTSAGVSEYYKVNQQIEIDSVTPDGNEYLIKKFRNLMGMALLPVSDFEFSSAYDNMVEANSVDLFSDLGSRPPYPFRVGLNQRGRSISLNFSTKNPLGVMTADTTHLFELSDLQLLWTYTQRAPENRTNTN